MAENKIITSDISDGNFILTTGNFEPGNAEEFCRSMDNPEKIAFSLAELCYYRGEIKTASKAFRQLCLSESPTIAAAATLGNAITALACENTDDVIGIFNTVKKLNALFEDLDFPTAPSHTFLMYFNLLIHNFSEVQFPSFGLQSFDVPDSLKPMAFYAYTHYLLETGDIGRAVGMAEGAMIFMPKPCVISEIYLCLIISRGYMLRKIWNKAEYYFKLAWSMAQPDGIIMPFAELRGMLSGMLEKCLRFDFPAEYKKISELSNKYHSGWVAVHNKLTGDMISDKLTAIEFNVASLAAKGSSNTEISDLLGISVNSVRAHLRNIFNKLGISSRKELDIFVI